MVTITIKQKDVEPYYNNINHWIILGITDDAIWSCIEIYTSKNPRLRYRMLRNNYGDIMQPVTKW